MFLGCVAGDKFHWHWLSLLAEMVFDGKLSSLVKIIYQQIITGKLAVHDASSMTTFIWTARIGGETQAHAVIANKHGLVDGERSEWDGGIQGLKWFSSLNYCH